MSERRGCGVRRARRALLLLPVVVAMTGCATIPTSGPVRAARDDLRLERGADVVPFIGVPPRPGASPQDVVAGFLSSSADFQNDHAVAREYLTPTARQRWRAQAGTVVYDQAPSPASLDGAPGALPSGVEGEVVTVTAEGTERGRIAADGRFTRSAPDTPLARPFQLERVGAEWRISQLEDGLLLTSSEVSETYRPVTLYFLAPRASTLVPDVVLLPELPGLTTKIVARLLRGPTTPLRGAAVTAIPEGTALEVPSVPVRDGVATVRLDEVALQADDEAREQLSAQLVWTLKQLPSVLRIRIMAGGEDLAVAGVAAEQPRVAWPQYDPDLLPATPTAFAVVDGQVGRYLDERFTVVDGDGGAEQPALRSPAVSLDGQRLAAVSSDGSTVSVGRMTVGGTLDARIRGTDLAAPSWDRDNNLWVVDRSNGQLLYLANGADEAIAVAVPDGPGGRLPTSVAVGRDGARVALVFGTGRGARLLIGGVSRISTAEGDDQVSVVDVAEPVPGLRAVLDAGWADATHLVALGSVEGAEPRPYVLGVDGYEVRDVAPLPGAVTVTAAPPQTAQGPPLVVGTADGQLAEFTSSRGWVLLGPGTDPAYPG